MKKFLLIPTLFIYFFGIAQSANSTLIIGKPIKIGNLLVAEHDFPKSFSVFDAKEACVKLGKGWRLPTKNELNTLYQNKKKIGGFIEYYYWSSTDYADYAYRDWYQSFSDGEQKYLNNPDRIHEEYKVRAVRTYSKNLIFYYDSLRLFWKGLGHKADSAFIIESPVRIGNLLFAQHNFPNIMKWDEANIACENLGYGWRLPNKDELDILERSRISVNSGALVERGFYWTSTVNVSYHPWEIKYNTPNEAYVRAVRAF
jgi:hypothetical protein